jgi:hypothetical protein
MLPATLPPVQDAQHLNEFAPDAISSNLCPGTV